MNLHTIYEVLLSTMFITCLVINMMLLIEILNIQSNGNIINKLKQSGRWQIVTASLLGLIPGCMGGFATVSLFTHKLVSFGALVAMMIASSGDEAFMILSIIPEKAIIIFPLLFVISIVAGVAVDAIFKEKKINFNCKEHFNVHKHQTSFPSLFKIESYKNILNPSKEKVIVIIGLILFMIANISGVLEHHHHHEHNHLIHNIGIANLLNERWINLAFIAVTLITLLYSAVSTEHFVKEHLWGHIIKKHLLSIFVWTFISLLIAHLIINNVHFENILSENIIVIILLAAIIGIIPESGPHLIFITLFATGVLPISVLITNSIVQDGHTTLPLLAESKSTFIKAKVINIIVGLIVGYGLYFLGF